MGDRDDGRRRSMIGAPPSVALKSTGKTPAVKRGAKSVESNVEAEASESEQSEQEEEQSEQSKPEENVKERRRRKKRKNRFTDPYGTKAKKRAERKEKALAEHKDEEDENEEESQKDTEPEQKEEEQKAPNYRDYSPFQLLCEFILRKFMTKDPDEYFAMPVSPEDAPDYHSIIQNPMDFHTMRQKISNNEYNHIDELKTDINLVVKNAMTYNQSQTVYYMAAQKLANLIKYYFSEQYIYYLRHHLPFGKEVPFEMMGLAPKSNETQRAEKPKKKNPAREAIVDNMTPQMILKSANKHVKDKLSSRVPKSHLAFIDNKDGATTLNIVTSPEKPSLHLSDLMDRLEKGTPGLTIPYEPRISAQIPISYTNYGPFSSFAPQYDSTWATLNKRDSDLLIACYGDKSNATNAISLRQMVEEAGDAVIKAVDGILNTLTDGEHSRTIKALSNPPENEKPKEAKTLNTEEIRQLLDEVATLQNIGLDTSFIESLKADLGIIPRPVSQISKSDRISAMISDLVALQTRRLSTQPPPTLTEAQPPQQPESQLAGKVVTELQSQISQYGVKPAELTTDSNIHQAIGLVDEADEDELLREFFVLP